MRLKISIISAILFIFVVNSIVFILFTKNRAEAQAPNKIFKIGLAVLKDNPDYHNGRRAFVNVLEEQKDMAFQFKLLHPNGDIEAYKRGLEEFVKIDNVDLIFTTGTRSTQPAVKIVKDIPIVFTAVAAPVRSHIVDDLQHPGANVTGTHCAVPAYAQLKTISKVVPTAKRIGIVYTEGELNAEIQTRDFKEAADKLNLTVITSTVSKSCNTIKEVRQATLKLVGKVDVLLAHQDTSLSRYGKGMIQVAEENNIPAYVSLDHLLSEGAVFSLSIDFYKIGALAGEQALKILKDNVEPDQIPVDTDKSYSLMINLSAAQKINLAIPIEVLRSASKIMR